MKPWDMRRGDTRRAADETSNGTPRMDHFTNRVSDFDFSSSGGQKFKIYRKKLLVSRGNERY